MQRSSSAENGKNLSHQKNATSCSVGRIEEERNDNSSPLRVIETRPGSAGDLCRRGL